MFYIGNSTVENVIKKKRIIIHVIGVEKELSMLPVFKVCTFTN